MNRVCEILGIEKPIIQGPMSWITSPEMAAAVSNAGGLGVLGPSAGAEEVATTLEKTTEDMRNAIIKTKQLTDKPFGIDIFPKGDDPVGYSQAIIQVMKEENVKIMVYAGTQCTPEEVKQYKEEGFTVIYRDINPTIRAAIAAEEAGADIIVATGCDEGGTMPIIPTGTTSIVALISEHVNIPVLAAGGIVNEKMAKAAAVVGAEGAFVGTRFILSKECRAAQNVKEDIMQTHPDDYIVFDQYFGLAKSRTTPHKVGIQGLEENKKGNKNPDTGSFYASMFKGDLDGGVNTMSNVASLIKSIDSCEDIVNELARGFE